MALVRPASAEDTDYEFARQAPCWEAACARVCPMTSRVVSIVFLFVCVCVFLLLLCPRVCVCVCVCVPLSLCLSVSLSLSLSICRGVVW